MRVAIASSANLPGWERDDRPFFEALSRRGIAYDVAAWDDPAVPWHTFDATLIRTTWDYHEKREAFVAWAKSCARDTAFFNPPEVIEWNSHKGYLRELATAGVPLATTEWLPRGSDVDVAQIVLHHGWKRAFLKPTVGLCASDTLRFDATEEGLRAASAHLDRHLPEGGFILQPYLDRVEIDGELSAIFFGGTFSHAVQKIPVKGDYRVQDDWGATDKAIALDAEHRKLAGRIVSVAQELLACRLLYARVDLMFDTDGHLVLTELELIEPSLFFRHGPHAPDLLIDSLLSALP